MKKISVILLILVSFSSMLSAEIKLSVSKNEYNKQTPVNGVYPVKLTFSDTENSSFYQIYRSKSNYGPYDFVKELTATNSKEYTYYDSYSFTPEEKYYYKVTGSPVSRKDVNFDPNSVTTSNIDNGYGALTHEKYFVYFNQVVINSHKRLVLMNKPRNLDKLGSETIYGKLTGSLFYKTKVSGMSGVVTMHYENFSDSEKWKFTGNMDTKANMLGNGTMSGTVTITGMYPGSICYDKVIIKDSKAGGGTYSVYPKGLYQKDLDYKITFTQK